MPRVRVRVRARVMVHERVKEPMYVTTLPSHIS